MNSQDYRRLVSMGLTPEQVAGVMEMFDEKEDVRKAGQRARWRKHQENKRNTNVSERELTTANVPRGQVTRVEDKPLPSEVVRKEEKKDTPQAALERVLSPELAEQVVAHRQRIRKPLTAYAAKLLAKQLETLPVPAAEAADAMIANGWQGVRPEYFLGRSGAGPPPKPNPGLAAVDALLEQVNAARSQTEPDPTYPRLVAFAGTG